MKKFKYPILILSVLLPLLILLLVRLSNLSYLHSYANVYSSFDIILLLIISPVVEEIVFRGLVQDSLLRYIKHEGLVFILVNILFVLIHIIKNNGIVYLLFLFICGNVFSIIKHLFGKLTYSILLHAYYNGLFVVFSL